jgi:hypothetical protein
MSALGLATEATIIILGIRFIAFFLLALVRHISLWYSICSNMRLRSSQTSLSLHFPTNSSQLSIATKRLAGIVRPLPSGARSPLLTKAFVDSNASQAIRTIIFNTKSHLGLNIGVLMAWIVLSLCTVSLFTYMMVRRERRSKFFRARE